MRHALKAVRLAGAVGALVLAAGAADATEVKFPKTHPRVALTVPDGWSIAYTPDGLELRSPEKDSIVVASFLKRDREAVDAWTKTVLTRMEAAGVTVDKSAEPPPEVKTANERATARAKAAEQSDGKPVDKDLPGTATTPSFAFAGGPSLALPNLGPANGALQPVQGGDDPKKPETSTPGTSKLDAPTSAPPTPAAPGGTKAPSLINGLRFQSVMLYGGKFKDKPTDMQLVLFSMPKDEVFAIEQQSRSDDNRAVAIIFSVKPLKH